jgi:gamma-glutamyltranspeptidase / glutathione hydrolase
VIEESGQAPVANAQSSGAVRALATRRSRSASASATWRFTSRKLSGLTEIEERTYDRTTAICFDHEHGTMHGAASDYGDDYGIA